MTRYREGKSALKKQGKRSAFQRKLKIVIRRERGPKIVEKKQNGQKGKKNRKFIQENYRRQWGYKIKKVKRCLISGKKGKISPKEGGNIKFAFTCFLRKNRR